MRSVWNLNLSEIPTLHQPLLLILHCPQNTLLSLLTVWRRRRSHRKNMISKLRRWAPSWENDCILAPDPFIKKIRTLYSLQLLKLKEIKWSYFFNLKLRGRVIINLKKALRLQNIVLTNLSYCSLKWRHIYRRHPGTVYSSKWESPCDKTVQTRLRSCGKHAMLFTFIVIWKFWRKNLTLRKI